MIRIISSVLLISLMTSIASCQGKTGNTATSSSIVNTKITVDEFADKLAATPNAQLVDVRTPAEYAEGHLKGAVNIDYRSDDFQDKIAKLDKSKPVFIYCLSGGRSSSAAGKMGDMGFQTVYNMDGGIMKWNSIGKPLDHAQEPSAAPGCHWSILIS